MVEWIPPLAQIYGQDMRQLGISSLTLFVLLIVLVTGLIGIIIGFGWWWLNRHGSKSPYGGGLLRKGNELDYAAVEKVQRFMMTLDPMPNPVFNLARAAVCVRTGRIFPNALNRFDVVKISRRFLEEHARNWIHGELVSWGSLDKRDRDVLHEFHQGIEGFQTEKSSRKIRPQDTEQEHWMRKPGPLYVNRRTGVLVGWKSVPGTDLEVLVIQRPRRPGHRWRKNP